MKTEDVALIIIFVIVAAIMLQSLKPHDDTPSAPIIVTLSNQQDATGYCGRAAKIGTGYGHTMIVPK